MQTLARVTDALGQELLVCHVDIFVEFGRKVDFARFNIGKDALKALDNLLYIVLRDNALTAEHGRVCDRALNILGIHPAVEHNGGVKVVDDGVGFLLEPAGPHFSHICKVLVS